MTDSAPERRYRRLGVGLFLLASALVVLAVPFAAQVAAVYRESVLRASFGAASAAVSESLVHYRSWVRCAGALALVSWPLVGGLWLVVWWKQDRERVKQLVPTLAVLLLPAAGLLVLAVGMFGKYGSFHDFRDYTDSNEVAAMRRAHYVAMLENFSLPHELWTATTGAVCALAVLGILATNLLPSVPRYQRGQLLVAGVTLALGLVAFKATRAHAEDATRPLPLWRPELQVPVFEVPGIETCGVEPAGLDAGVMIRIAENGALFQWGEPVGDLYAFDELLRDRFQPQSGGAAVRRLLIVAPPSLRVEALAPALATARAAGASTFLAARSEAMRSWQSSTIGKIRYSQRTCAMPFDPAALPKTGTWGEWAAKDAARPLRAGR